MQVFPTGLCLNYESLSKPPASLNFLQIGEGCSHLPLSFLFIVLSFNFFNFFQIKLVRKFKIFFSIFCLLLLLVICFYLDFSGYDA